MLQTCSLLGNQNLSKHLVSFSISSPKQMRKGNLQQHDGVGRIVFLEDEQSNKTKAGVADPAEPPSVMPPLTAWAVSGVHWVCVGTTLPPLPRCPGALMAALPAQATQLLSKQAGGRALGFSQLKLYHLWQQLSIHYGKTACIPQWLIVPSIFYCGSFNGGTAADSFGWLHAVCSFSLPGPL